MRIWINKERWEEKEGGNVEEVEVEVGVLGGWRKKERKKENIKNDVGKNTQPTLGGG